MKKNFSKRKDIFINTHIKICFYPQFVYFQIKLIKVILLYLNYLLIKWQSYYKYFLLWYKWKIWNNFCLFHTLVKGLYSYPLWLSGFFLLFPFKSFWKIFFLYFFKRNCWVEKYFYWITWLFISFIKAILVNYLYSSFKVDTLGFLIFFFYYPKSMLCFEMVILIYKRNDILGIRY